MRIIESKKKKGLCVACRCTRKSTAKDRFCTKHSKRYQKENNPVNYTYNLLRSNAHRRGHSFSLSLDEFRGFCESNNYLDLKGRSAKSYSIDRIDSKKGYEIGNIRLLTVSENSKKKDKDEAPF